MRWLARLYPAGWRRRYGAELGTVLGAQRPSLRGALDVVLGALDAHLNPHLWRSPGPAVERLSEPGRRVLALAQEEARRLDHGYLGTEHVLLGLVRDPGSAAARTLADLGVGIDELRARIEAFVGRGLPIGPGRCGTAAAGERRLTPRTKRVLERAAEEADSRHHARVGDVHLLVGQKEGVGAGCSPSWAWSTRRRSAPGWRRRWRGTRGRPRGRSDRQPTGRGCTLARRGWPAAPVAAPTSPTATIEPDAGPDRRREWRMDDGDAAP